jgi:DNA polymerase III epsilon subunit-like protein
MTAKTELAPIVFIDTETTSLRHDRRAWEIGAIRREPDGTEAEHHWFIDACGLDLGNADLMSLKIGRFHERHPHGSASTPWSEAISGMEHDTLHAVEQVTRGAHLAGAVVSFDADVLGQRMRANGICPSWHYHLIDVEALAVGYLMRDRVRSGFDGSMLPWKSDELSAELGISSSDEDRHTALGDAKWARAIYDAVMGRRAPQG